MSIFTWFNASLFFLTFVFSNLNSKNIRYKNLLLTSFKPRNSSTWSGRSANWATMSARCLHKLETKEFYWTCRPQNMGLKWPVKGGKSFQNQSDCHRKLPLKLLPKTCRRSDFAGRSLLILTRMAVWPDLAKCHHFGKKA